MVVVSWNGEKWGITDWGYFESCYGPLYCTRYFVLDTLGQ